jgi:hypothetical protein
MSKIHEVVSEVEVELPANVDEIAKSIDWFPIKNLRNASHISDVNCDNEIITIESSWKSIYPALLIASGVLALLLVLILVLSEAIATQIFATLFISVAILFIGVFLVKITQKTQISKIDNEISQTNPSLINLIKPTPNVEPFQPIYALQVIDQEASLTDDKGAETGETELMYQLNLIFKDESRTNLICHGHLESIQESADAIGSFLNVPTWKALR